MRTVWTDDVALCINKIDKEFFMLEDVYAFEEELSIKYPNNNNIRAKIRQQLQVLRDEGDIAFIKRGHYKKLR